MNNMNSIPDSGALSCNSKKLDQHHLLTKGTKRGGADTLHSPHVTACSFYPRQQGLQNVGVKGNSSSKTSVVSELGRVMDILQSAEGIVVDREAEDDKIQGPSRKRELEDAFQLEPTPLAPHGVVRGNIVQELPLSENIMYTENVQEDMLSILRPLLVLNQADSAPPSVAKKRRRRSSTKETSVPGLAAPLRVESRPCRPDSFNSSSDSEDDEERFRPYQSNLWNDRFQDLTEFQEKHGHCLVPHNFPENQQLAQWIKRQRYQYKLKLMKRHSTLTEDRQSALEKLGFIWDSHKAAWIERFESLKTFHAQYGHSSVPSNYVDRSLAIWVKCQRRQYKMFQHGAKSTMTRERFCLLDALGFDWNPRNLR